MHQQISETDMFIQNDRDSPDQMPHSVASDQGFHCLLVLLKFD